MKVRDTTRAARARASPVSLRRGARRRYRARIERIRNSRERIRTSRRPILTQLRYESVSRLVCPLLFFSLSPFFFSRKHRGSRHGLAGARLSSLLFRFDEALNTSAREYVCINVCALPTDYWSTTPRHLRTYSSGERGSSRPFQRLFLSPRCR